MIDPKAKNWFEPDSLQLTITELAEVLRGAELDDLRSLFMDEMSELNSPIGYSTEISSGCVNRE
jgi:hypothetical protein